MLVDVLPRSVTPRSRVALSRRDRLILDLARSKLAGSTFEEAVRALREAMMETIPDGRIFILGMASHGPIVGSLISGVGIADFGAGIRIVRVAGERIDTLGIVR
jgi:hypothetical protein